MELQEIIAKKEQLEKNIIELIEEFSNETGIEGYNINVRRDVVLYSQFEVPSVKTIVTVQI